MKSLRAKLTRITISGETRDAERLHPIGFIGWWDRKIMVQWQYNEMIERALREEQ